MTSYNTNDSIHFNIGQLKNILAYHWLFVLYGVIILWVLQAAASSKIQKYLIYFAHVQYFNR